MDEKIEKLKRKIRRCRENWYPRHEIQTEEAKWIVHYTGLPGLLNVISSKESGLLAFETSEMSDPDEGRVRRPDQEIAEVLERMSIESWCKKRYSSATICCFVAGGREGSDEMLFWQLYGGKGRGVSIAIPKHVWEHWYKTKVVEPVRYVEIGSNGGGRIEREVEDLVGEIDEVNKATEGEECKEIRRESDNLFRQRFLTKSEAYQYEREVRTVRWKGGEEEVGEEMVTGTETRIRRGWQYESLKTRRWLTSTTRITVGQGVTDAEQVTGIVLDRIKTVYGREKADAIQVMISAKKIR